MTIRCCAFVDQVIVIFPLANIAMVQRKMPLEGWDDEQIRFLLRDLALMDSNNFVDNVGVGEREARVYCSIVRDKHFSMAHGVGRSGDLTAEQPKAAGSSLLGKLTNLMVLNALKLAGLENVTSCAVLPVATGMAIALSLLGIQSQRPGCSKVIWPRVDQKTCLKSILALNLSPVIIENVQEGDEVVADLEEIERQVPRPLPDLCQLAAGGSRPCRACPRVLCPLARQQSA